MEISTYARELKKGNNYIRVSTLNVLQAQISLLVHKFGGGEVS